LAWSIAQLAADATANVDTTREFEASIGWLSIMFLLNLPINLFVYSALLLAFGSKFGKGLFTDQSRSVEIFSGVLLVAFIMTFIGILIDGVFLYDRREDNLLTYSTIPWMAAALAVAMSVYVLSVAIMRTDLLITVAIVCVIAVTNLLAWTIAVYFVADASFAWAYLPSFVAAVVCPLTLFYLDRWHRQTCLHELADVA